MDEGRDIGEEDVKMKKALTTMGKALMKKALKTKHEEEEEFLNLNLCNVFNWNKLK